MDIIVFILSVAVFLLGLALFSNRVRARQEIPFDLKPNCLLTRWPLLFVTGPRSIFYFSSYWNLYTSFLAEHGYEVFTLHLPWKDSEERRERVAHFLDQQEKHQRRFHLFVDTPTLTELKDLLAQRKSPAVISLSEIRDAHVPAEPGSLKGFPPPLGGD
ncbi:hypothetical protein [Bdellovibrio bacteriovorus]|uniref:hypothetical protein n=1 Tax=Bdellovibrio bacteriovorus TaxID=959 RepID=UPI0035A68F0F